MASTAVWDPRPPQAEKRDWQEERQRERERERQWEEVGELGRRRLSPEDTSVCVRGASESESGSGSGSST